MKLLTYVSIIYSQELNIAQVFLHEITHVCQYHIQSGIEHCSSLPPWNYSRMSVSYTVRNWTLLKSSSMKLLTYVSTIYSQELNIAQVFLHEITHVCQYHIQSGIDHCSSLPPWNYSRMSVSYTVRNWPLLKSSSMKLLTYVSITYSQELNIAQVFLHELTHVCQYHIQSGIDHCSSLPPWNYSRMSVSYTVRNWTLLKSSSMKLLTYVSITYSQELNIAQVFLHEITHVCQYHIQSGIEHCSSLPPWNYSRMSVSYTVRNWTLLKSSSMKLLTYVSITYSQELNIAQVFLHEITHVCQYHIQSGIEHCSSLPPWNYSRMSVSYTVRNWPLLKSSSMKLLTYVSIIYSQELTIAQVFLFLLSMRCLNFEINNLNKMLNHSGSLDIRDFHPYSASFQGNLSLITDEGSIHITRVWSIYFMRSDFKMLYSTKEKSLISISNLTSSLKNKTNKIRM